jgi:hypothetical protein
MHDSPVFVWFFHCLVYPDPARNDLPANLPFQLAFLGAVWIRLFLGLASARPVTG